MRIPLEDAIGAVIFVLGTILWGMWVFRKAAVNRSAFESTSGAFAGSTTAVVKKPYPFSMAVVGVFLVALGAYVMFFLQINLVLTYSVNSPDVESQTYRVEIPYEVHTLKEGT